MANEASVIAFSKGLLSISTASFLQEKNFLQRTYLHRDRSSDEEIRKAWAEHIRRLGFGGKARSKHRAYMHQVCRDAFVDTIAR